MSSRVEEEILRIREMLSESRAPFSNGPGAESNVVENIIRPILRSLGWTDGVNRILNEFEVKLRRKKGRADLVLSKGHNKYILAVEAKKLGGQVYGTTQAFETHIEQLLDYLISLKREFGILTDGEWWHLIQRDGYGWETIWIKNLLTTDLANLIHAFSYISPDISEGLLETIQMEKKKLDILGTEWAKIQEDREIQLETFTDLLLRQVQSKYEDVSLEIHEIMEFLEERYNGLALPSDKPIIIDLPPIASPHPGKKHTRPPSGSRITIRGNAFDIRSYRDIIFHAGEWLAAKEKLNKTALTRQSKNFPSRLPILVKADNKEAARKMMKRGHPSAIRELRNMKGWFIDVNHAPYVCWERAQDLLEISGLERTALEANDILAQDLERKK